MNLPTTSLAEPDLASRGSYSDPYPVYDYLRMHGPVHWSPQWGGWLLTRFKDVFAILRDAKRFSNVGRMSKFLNQLPENIRHELRPFEDHFQEDHFQKGS
jgi:cytochrome P450